jgi:pimeloyl-ACP methyl ester carboxylesterase
MLTEHRFHTGVVTLNYAEGEASGPPLVLLHRAAARWQSALPLIPALSRRWHVYAPDLRGHGHSGRVPGCYGMRDYAADIVAFLQQVVKEPAVLFAHSMGGNIAMLVAAGSPHRVRGLILGDTPFDLAKLRAALQRDQRQWLYWRALAGHGLSLEEMTEALKNMPMVVKRQPDPVAARLLLGKEHPWFADMAENLRLLDPDMLTAFIEFIEFGQGSEEFDPQRLFPLITCPVLIIQGSPAHGGMLTNAEIEQALTLLPAATVARMETVGHPLHTQQKEPVLLALTAFLDTL